MYAKIILNTVLITGLVIIQLSFISGLPAQLNNLNLVLVILVFILGLATFNIASWWAVGAGVLLDIFSFAPFGLYMASLILTIAVINFLLNHFFTNRSLYSFLALIGLATLFYEIILFIINFLAQWVSAGLADFNFNVNFFLDKLIQLGLNLLAAFIIFYFINFISKKLRPVFLTGHK